MEDQTQQGLSPLTLAEMQEHRNGNDTEFHHVLTTGHRRPEEKRESPLMVALRALAIIICIPLFYLFLLVMYSL